MPDSAHISQFISTQRGFGRTDAQIAQALSTVTDEIEDVDDLRAFVATMAERPESYASDVRITSWWRAQVPGFLEGGPLIPERKVRRLAGGVDKRWDVMPAIQTGGGAPGPKNPTDIWDPVSLSWVPRPRSIKTVIPKDPVVLRSDLGGWWVDPLTDADRAVNVILGGEDETISARVGRREGPVEGAIADVLDWVDPGHTAGAVRAQDQRSGNWIPTVPVSTARALARKLSRACCYCR
jgi:hypothetical protein